MPLYGVTHSLAGKPLVRLAKTLKVGIGYPKGPAIHVYIDRSGQWTVEVGSGKETKRSKFQTRNEAQAFYAEARKTAPERKYPGKFGYFTFQRVGIDGSFTPDFDAIEIHGPMPTEIGVVFLENDPLHQRFEWWTAAELKCSGDGRDAKRRLSEAKSPEELKLATEASGIGEQFFPVSKCFVHGCQFAKGDRPLCKPHSRLSFQLVNAPALGATCTFDSTGFRSAAQLASSLEQIRTITGRGNPDDGVVAGIPLILKLLPYKTSHQGQPSTQFGVTLYLKAKDALELVRGAITAGDEFRSLAHSALIQIEAGGVEVEAAQQMLTEAAEATALEAEFYPVDDAEIPVDDFEFEEATGTKPTPHHEIKRKSETAQPPAPPTVDEVQAIEAELFPVEDPPAGDPDDEAKTRKGRNR